MQPFIIKNKKNKSIMVILCQVGTGGFLAANIETNEISIIDYGDIIMEHNFIKLARIEPTHYTTQATKE